MRILLTEDDQELARITAQNLKKEGLAVDVALNGEEALCLLEGNGDYDVAILDLKLPDVDGLELLKSLKSIAPHLPVLALTAKDSEQDRVAGLNLGFDDYLVKPFSLQELAARLRILYRSHPSGDDKKIKIGSLKIDAKSQRVLVKNSLIKLTLNEFRALFYLASHQGQPVPAQTLLAEVWDNNHNSQIAKVLTTVSRLRKKIGDQKHKIIRTEKEGYIV